MLLTLLKTFSKCDQICVIANQQLAANFIGLFDMQNIQLHKIFDPVNEFSYYMKKIQSYHSSNVFNIIYDNDKISENPYQVIQKEA